MEFQPDQPAHRPPLATQAVEHLHRIQVLESVEKQNKPAPAGQSHTIFQRVHTIHARATFREHRDIAYNTTVSETWHKKYTEDDHRVPDLMYELKNWPSSSADNGMITLEY